jgi:hypothetical protein
MRPVCCLALLFLIVGAPRSTSAQLVTDGDTLKQHGVTYRLWGIDAPEAKQVCPDGWPAGSIATTRLLLHVLRDSTKSSPWAKVHSAVAASETHGRELNRDSTALIAYTHILTAARCGAALASACRHEISDIARPALNFQPGAARKPPCSVGK